MRAMWIMWYVHYNRSGIAGMITLATLPLALEKACVLLQQGMNVSKIEGSNRYEGMTGGEIRAACAERKAE
jgi:hypothetical protein